MINSNSDKRNGIFTTLQTALAAYLYTEGFEIIDVEVNYGKTPSVFLFVNSEELQLRVKDFQLNKAMVNAAQYFEAYRKCLVMVKHGKI